MECLEKAEVKLIPYRNVIGVAMIIMLIVMGIQLYKFNELHKEMIEKGGYTDGKIKCVCSQEAWDMFESERTGDLNLNISVSEELGNGK